MSPFALPDLSEFSSVKTFAEALRIHEQPEGPIEEALIDRIILAAHRVRSADEALENTGLTDRDASRVLADAERSWTRALAEWTRYRKAQKSLRPASKPAPETPQTPEPAPTPAPDPTPAPEPCAPPKTPAPRQDHVSTDPALSRPIFRETHPFVQHFPLIIDGDQPVRHMPQKPRADASPGDRELVRSDVPLSSMSST